ncbi:MAG: mechanosensitive ion channel domain-containing protein [Planctomycetota bacterium]
MANSEPATRVSGVVADVSTLWQQYGPMAMDWSGRILAAIVIVVVAWIVAGSVRRLVRQSTGRTHLDLTIAKFLANAAWWGILVLAMVTAMGQLGVQTANFTAVLAATGLAIGLAFQSTLSNFASGVILLVFRPFKVGDAVNIAGQAGSVNEVGLFMTEIDTADGRRIVLPNSQISGNVIENTSHHSRRRAEVIASTIYDTDLDTTRAVLEAAVRRVPGILTDPAPEVAITAMSPASVQWAVRAWATREQLGVVQQQLFREVKSSLEAAKIAVPVPVPVLVVQK